MTEIKFCGMTRAEDAAKAVELGVAYVGLVLAGGPRMVTVEHAREVLAAIPAGGPRRVGVFGADAPHELARMTRVLKLDVVQLHKQRREDVDAATPAQVRQRIGVPVWAVLRCAGGLLPADADRIVEGADGILLDAAVPGRLGGAGVALPWEDMAPAVAAMRGARPLILAGGLRPENVARAILALRPNVVDVSSGIEQSPGIKDHARMRAFVDAVLDTAQGV